MAEGAPAEYHFHSPMRSQMAALARKHKMLTERERARRALEMRNAHLEALWDPSKHTICPPNLKGLKPVTHEPWARDATVYAQKTGSFQLALRQLPPPSPSAVAFHSKLSVASMAVCSPDSSSGRTPGIPNRW